MSVPTWADAVSPLWVGVAAIYTGAWPYRRTAIGMMMLVAGFGLVFVSGMICGQLFGF